MTLQWTCVPYISISNFRPCIWPDVTGHALSDLFGAQHLLGSCEVEEPDIPSSPPPESAENSPSFCEVRQTWEIHRDFCCQNQIHSIFHWSPMFRCDFLGGPITIPSRWTEKNRQRCIFQFFLNLLRIVHIKRLRSCQNDLGLLDSGSGPQLVFLFHIYFP